MSAESRVFASEDAKQLIENPMLVSAFESVGSYLESQALGCDPDNKDKAQRIVIAKQLLAGVKREIERVIEDGTVARIQMAEIENRKRSIFGIRR